MDLDRYQFEDETQPRWFVAHSHSTGSSMDGTRQHSWRAVRLRRYIRSDIATYDSEAEAVAVARDLTERNVQP